MDKLDRLVWADGMSFTAYGVRVGLRVSDAAILPDLIARLPPSFYVVFAEIVIGRA